MITSVASFIVTLGGDGAIVNQGSLTEVLASKQILHAIEQDFEKHQNDSNPENSKGKLIMPEDIQEGRVGWNAFKFFLDSLGGKWPILFWAIFVGSMFSIYFLNAIQTWWLGYWASKYGTVYDVTAS